MASEKAEDLMQDVPREVIDFENKDNVVYRKVIFEPIRIGPVSTLDEMDEKVLKFQNSKLQMVRRIFRRLSSHLQSYIYIFRNWTNINVSMTSFNRE